MTREQFESAIRDGGDLAGVFEYDGDTGYFYLYAVGDEDRERIVDSIHVVSGATDLEDADIAVRWDGVGERVALFLRGVQWAVFNTVTGRKFGGGFRPGGIPAIPVEEALEA